MPGKRLSISIIASFIISAEVPCRRVNSHALGPRPHIRYGRLDAVKVAAAPEQRLGIALARGLPFYFVEVLRQPGKCLEILSIKFLRVFAVSAEACLQRIDSHAVEEAEVYNLGPAALLVVHIMRAHSKHARGHFGMHITALFKYVYQPLIIREHRHQPQLYLTVVKRHQPHPLARDKGVAYAPAQVAFNRDVLQIRVSDAMRPLPRRLHIAGVYAVIFIEQRGQRIDSAEQFGELAVA